MIPNKLYFSTLLGQGTEAVIDVPKPHQSWMSVTFALHRLSTWTPGVKWDSWEVQFVSWRRAKTKPLRAKIPHQSSLFLCSFILYNVNDTLLQSLKHVTCPLFLTFVRKFLLINLNVILIYLSYKFYKFNLSYLK